MSGLSDVVLGVVWLFLQVGLAWLASPPRVELAARLGPGEPQGKTTMKRGALLRLAIQSQQYQDVEDLTLTLTPSSPDKIEWDNVWGCVGPLEASDYVHVTKSKDGAFAIEVKRLRGMKTILFDLGCSAGIREVSGQLVSSARPLSSVVSEALPAFGKGKGLDIEFCVPWSLEGDGETASGKATSHLVEPWATRFEQKGNRETKVLATGALVALVGFAFFARLFGLDPLTDPGLWVPAGVVSVVLVAATSVVFALVRPKPRPIAQGFFEPRRIEFKPKSVEMETSRGGAVAAEPAP